MVEKHGTITDTCKALLKEKITDFQELIRSPKQAIKAVQVNTLRLLFLVDTNVSDFRDFEKIAGVRCS